MARKSLFSLVAILLALSLWSDHATEAGQILDANSVDSFSGTEGAGGFYYGFFTTPGQPSTFSTEGMKFEAGYWSGPWIWLGSNPSRLPFFTAATAHPFSTSETNGQGHQLGSAVREYRADSILNPIVADVKLTFEQLDPRSDGVDVRLYDNARLIFSADTSTTGGALEDVTLFGIALNPKDTLQLEVAPHESILYDDTFAEFSILQVAPVTTPEPSAVVYFIVGGLFCSIAHVFRRKRCRTY
jgi:hypothetical protein